MKFRLMWLLHFGSVLIGLLTLASACGQGSGGSDDSGPIEFAMDFTEATSLPPECEFVISDYPEGEEAFHEINTGLVDLPVEVGDGRGLLYTANNHSDDIDSNLIVSLDAAHGLAANTLYSIQATFTFYSNTPTGCGGIGGGPDAVDFRLCASNDPTSVDRVVDENNHWRLPLGRSTCGAAGNIGTSGTDCMGENPWSLETRTSEEIQVETASDGSLFISISTHSGYESTSTFYHLQAQITLEPVL